MSALHRRLLATLVALPCLVLGGTAHADWQPSISNVMSMVYCLVGTADCEGLQPGADTVTQVQCGEGTELHSSGTHCVVAGQADDASTAPAAPEIPPWSVSISDVMGLVYCLVGLGDCAGLQPGLDTLVMVTCGDGTILDAEGSTCVADGPTCGPALPTHHAVDVVDMAFSPAELTIHAGDTVTWHLIEGIHNVASVTDGVPDGVFDSGFPPWETFSVTFDTPGEVHYICEAHPTMMQAVIVVLEADDPCAPDPVDLSILDGTWRNTFGPDDAAIHGTMHFETDADGQTTGTYFYGGTSDFACSKPWPNHQPTDSGEGCHYFYTGTFTSLTASWTEGDDGTSHILIEGQLADLFGDDVYDSDDYVAHFVIDPNVPNSATGGYSNDGFAPLGDEAWQQWDLTRITACAANEHVQDHHCWPCPAWTDNDAGDDVNGPDTSCACPDGGCDCPFPYHGDLCQEQMVVPDELVQGYDSTCARIGTDVKCWGSAVEGGLGLGYGNVGDEEGELGAALPFVDIEPFVFVERVEVSNNRWGAFSCAQLSTGSLLCWGDNAQGQLGVEHAIVVGASPESMGAGLVPVMLPAGTAVVDYALGAAHACALLNDGTVRCWGRNNDGQLGQGHTDDMGDDPGEMGSLAPVDLGTDAAVVAVRAYQNNSCVILDGGVVKCWGANAFGNLGAGHNQDRGDGPGEMGDALPALALTLPAVDLQLGGYGGCALLEGGAVKCWGYNGNGGVGIGDKNHIGDGPDEFETAPLVDLGTGLTASQLSVGFGHGCVILDDVTGALTGAVKCWGWNVYGHLGLGDIENRGDQPGEMGDALPVVELGSGAPVASVHAFWVGTCVRRTDDTISCFGDVTNGIAGHPIMSFADEWLTDVPDETGDALPTVDLGTDAAITSLSTNSHGCASFDDGSVKCWGSNGNGQLGMGWAANLGMVPASTGDNLPFVDAGGEVEALLGAGRSHVCVRMAGGDVKCWGNNEDGQLGQGDTFTRGMRATEMGTNLLAVPLGTEATVLKVVGEYHFNCALFDNGKVKCWGNNERGQLGRGDTDSRGDEPGEMGENLPWVDLGTDLAVVDIAAGMRHVCARFEGGGVKCWGHNGGGQLGLGDTAHRGDAPDEMGTHLPFVDVGEGTVVDLVATMWSACVLLSSGEVRCWGSGWSGTVGHGNANDHGDEPGEMGAALPSIDLGTDRTATAIYGGYGHVCALLDDQSMKCWGSNPHGALGLGDTENRGDEPGEMGDGLPALDFGDAGPPIKVLMGVRSQGACAQFASGGFKCWGANDNGQLALGDSNNRGDEPGEMGDNLPWLNVGSP